MPIGILHGGRAADNRGGANGFITGEQSSNLDVVMKVLLPETLIKIYQDVKNLTYDQAEDELLYGDISEPEVPAGEVFI